MKRINFIILRKKEMILLIVLSIILIPLIIQIIILQIKKLGTSKSNQDSENS